MKRTTLAFVILAVTIGLFLAGQGKASAMNNESAALLAGGIAIFGPSVLYGITGGYYSPAGYGHYYWRPYYPPRWRAPYKYGWYGGRHGRYNYRGHDHRHEWNRHGGRDYWQDRGHGRRGYRDHDRRRR